MMTHVENEQRVFSREQRRRAVVRDLRGLLVPPDIAPLCPSDIVAGALQDDDVLDRRALLQRCIHDRLGRDRLATAATLVRRNNDARAAVQNAVAQGLGGESGEHDRVHCAYPGAG